MDRRRSASHRSKVSTTRLFEPLMAAALVFALPVIVVFMALQRHFVHGLTVGGVKG